MHGETVKRSFPDCFGVLSLDVVNPFSQTELDTLYNSLFTINQSISTKQTRLQTASLHKLHINNIPSLDTNITKYLSARDTEIRDQCSNQESPNKIRRVRRNNKLFILNEDCEGFERFRYSHNTAYQPWEIILWKQSRSTAAAAQRSFTV
jgi:hypothetical protein